MHSFCVDWLRIKIKMRRVSKMHTECTQVSTQTLCGCYFLVLCKCVSFFRTTTLSSESSECRRQAVNSMKALLWVVAPKGSNLLSYTPPPPLPPLTPHCDELTPSAGPECTSNTGPKISGVGADLSFNLLFFKHLDTRLHSSVTRKNYTWQVCLRAWQNVYMRAGARQKRWHQCKSSKCLLIFLLPI